MLAAKVLVISRLLHKKLSLGSQSLSYLDTIRGRLASLRRKLPLRIDAIFQRLETTEEALIGAMCAFSLATSSSPTDVLRHYHHVRLEALCKQAQDGGSIEVALLQALQYFIQTLKDTKTYIPGKLAEALQAIKSTPIFQSKELHSLIELNLDVYERWIDEDIKKFIPYIRDVELKRAEAGRATADWAKQAFLSFSTILQVRLKSITDATVLARLRKQILRLWLSTPQRSLGIDTGDVLEGLHNIFIAQTTRLIWSQTMSLQTVAKAIEDTLHNGKKYSSGNNSTLWASSIAGMEISNGGKAFTESVLARFNGRYEALEAFSLEYKMWLQRIVHLEGMIKDIRETKWDDAVDDIEEDDILDDKQILLSEDDPRLLQEEFHDALRKSLTSLQDSIEGLTPELDEPNSVEKVAYLLRVWKDVRGQLPISYRDPGIGIGSVLALQELMAALAIKTPLSASEKLIVKAAHNEQLVSRTLWEGNQELPVFPSSWVFRLLHDLVHSMTALGSDIWGPQATDTLKKQLRAGLASHFKRSLTPVSQISKGENDNAEKEPRQQLAADEVDLTNGEDSLGDGITAKGVNLDSRTQGLFDMIYLNVATTRKSGTDDNDDGMAGIIKVTEGEVGLDEACMRRMRRNAEEYWKRTSLLFALIA